MSHILPHRDKGEILRIEQKIKEAKQQQECIVISKKKPESYQPGTDYTAQVDQRGVYILKYYFRLFNRLRVVDASIFPDPTVIMAAKKIADRIKKTV